MSGQQKAPDDPGTDQRTAATQQDEPPIQKEATLRDVPAAPTEESPADSSEDLRDDAEAGAIREATPAKETGNIPHQVILQGRGWATWDTTVQQHLAELHPEKERASVGDKVAQACRRSGGYFAPLTLNTGLVVAVIECLNPPKTKKQVGQWLEWWLVTLQTIKGKIVTVVSPSTDYDPISKMLGAVIEAGVVTIGDKVKATPRYKENKKVLDEIADYIAKEPRYAQRPDDQHSEAGTVATKESSSESSESSEENEIGGAGEPEEEEEILSEVGDVEYQQLPNSFNLGTPSVVRKVLQELEEEEPEQHKKETRKKKHTENRGQEDFLPPLKKMPAGTRKYENQAGLTAYNHFGEPWDIDSHGLIVLTNFQLKPHITRFRKKLRQEGGHPYKEEIDERLPLYRDTRPAVVITSGGNSSHFAVLHVPIEKYQDKVNLDTYRDDLEEALETGVERASEMSYKRVIICNDGTRSGNLPWEVAEEAALRVMNHLVKAAHAWSHIQELVIVTSVKQYQERREQILRPLYKTEGPNNWRAGKPKYENDEAPIQRAVIPRRPSSPVQTKEAAERGSYRESTPGHSSKAERAPQASSSQGKPATKKVTPSAALRCVAVQTEVETPEPRRSENAVTSPTGSAGAQRMRYAGGEEGCIRFLCPEKWCPDLCAEPSRAGPRTPIRSPEQVPQAPPTPPPEAESEGDAGAESSEEDPAQSLTSIEYEPPKGVQDLKQGSRKGKKNALPLHSVHSASQRMARDIQYGAMITKDGRKAFVPEVGQTSYEVPEVWLGDLEGMKGAMVYATKGEWANFLMSPTYGSLATASELTGNFRAGFVAIVYDVMLRRLKKAAYKLAKEEEKARRQDISDSDEEQQLGTEPSSARNNNFTTTGEDEGLLKMQASTQSFNEFKKIKAMVANKDPKESVQEYLTQKWR